MIAILRWLLRLLSWPWLAVPEKGEWQLPEPQQLLPVLAVAHATRKRRGGGPRIDPKATTTPGARTPSRALSINTRGAQ
jgi:hypothetical protein